MGVPLAALPGLLAAVEHIAAARVLIATFGHAGDGNMHPTVLFDRNHPDALARAKAAFEDILHAALALGGTITGEHGVGTLKRAFWPASWAPRRAAPPHHQGRARSAGHPQPRQAALTRGALPYRAGARMGSPSRSSSHWA